MSGLFGTFSIATRGMEVQQKALDVTSHNIANANTDGYSRQRAVIETSRPEGMPSMNSIISPGQVGTGAQVSAIERVRDSFMDFQVRGQKSTLGKYQARDNFLSEIEGIFSEPSDTGMSKLISNFFSSWHDLSGDPNNSNTRTVVATSASTLANSLNQTYNNLQNIKTNVQSQIKDDIFTINSMFKNLDQLNQQIKGVEISGNTPNDLMDKRDLLLDDLSGKFGIKIDKQQFDAFNLTADSSTSGFNPSVNINFMQSEDHENVRTLSYIDSITVNDSTATPPTYDITYYKKADKSTDANKVTISGVALDSTQLKQLDECRVVWADKDGNAIKSDGTLLGQSGVTYNDIMQFKPDNGELQGYMSVQQDVDDYINQMNSFAKALAFSVNAVHTGTNDPLTPNSDVPNIPFYVNSSSGGKEEEITAGNIAVNSVILNDVMKINVKSKIDSGATDGSRAQAIADVQNSLLQIQGITTATKRSDFVTLDTDNMTVKNSVNGTTLGSYFKDTVDRLGISEQEAQQKVKNQNATLEDFQQRRDGISGVSLDEEIANLVQFQHAYQANAKIVSTIDQLLDVVINGLKK